MLNDTDMKLTKLLQLTAATLLLTTVQTAQAQTEAERIPHASMWLQAPSANFTRVGFRYDDPGTEYRVRWGMDTAWDDAANIRRGTYHIGSENLTYGRLSFQPSDSVGDDLQLSRSQSNRLRQRISRIKLTGTTKVLLNCDHNDPALIAKYYYGKPKNWYNVIKAACIEAQNQGITIEAIAPMNEPDLESNGQGTKEHFRAVVELLRADPFFDDIRISAGNTLNPDFALEWYNFMKPYVDEGNTHQLAGTFANYANFFQVVRRDGKIATADELHNTMEAFVAAEYGLQNGIWWGYDGVTRGRYCRATSGGQRLGYGESRSTWTAGCVYRLPDGSVDAFLGSSERQANTNTFELASYDRDVYYDGFGPTRVYTMEIPGGTGYQVGQTNAECTIHIKSGEDVPLGPIVDGTYLIMNSATQRLMSTNNNSSNGATVSLQSRHDGRKDELWTVEAVPARVGGDFCYHFITNTVNNRLLDVQNRNLNNGGTIIAYPGGKGDIEQWHFIYAGNGDYYIQSRFSGLYLAVTSSTSNVTQRTMSTNDSYFRWRLIPTDAALELKAPAAPVGLTATPRLASVLLEWAPNTESDFSSYIVQRSEVTPAGTTEWQTICNSLEGTQFLDNSCAQGVPYAYRVRAVDRSGNRSDASEAVETQTSEEKGLVARYTFDENIFDETDNQMDAVCDNETPTWGTTTLSKKQGTASIYLNDKESSKHYISLPYQVGNKREMTIATWVRWRGGKVNQRIFDFGGGPDQYFALSPKGSSNTMTFTIKKGDQEQALSAPSALGTSVWRHVAVTFSDEGVKLYLQGQEVASSEDITLRPSDIQPGLCYLGRSQSSSDPYFYGYLDDFCVYNYALTPEEIAIVMDDLYTGIGTASTSFDGAASPVVKSEYFTLGGVPVKSPGHGLTIVRQHHADGSISIRKVVK